jgi:hypothetical protein
MELTELTEREKLLTLALDAIVDACVNNNPSTNPYLCLKGVKDVMTERPDRVLTYAMATDGRFPEGEATLADSDKLGFSPSMAAKMSYIYCTNVDEPIEVMERTICLDPHTAGHYLDWFRLRLPEHRRAALRAAASGLKHE